MTFHELHKILDDPHRKLSVKEFQQVLYNLKQDTLHESNAGRTNKRTWYSGETNAFQICLDLSAHLEPDTSENETPEQKLLRLVAENPALPVVAMVATEVVCDDSYAHWLGKFGSCEVQEYIIHETKYDEARVIFKEDAEEELFEEFYDEAYESGERDTISESEWEEYAEAAALRRIRELEYTKAIVLYICS